MLTLKRAAELAISSFTFLKFRFIFFNVIEAQFSLVIKGYQKMEIDLF